MKKTKKKTCKLGSLCPGLKYDQIGHQPGGLIWWIWNGEIRKHISKGTINDFHFYLVRQTDNIEADYVYRGRATTKTRGICTILPPTEIYSQPDIQIPTEIIALIKKELKPALLLVSTPQGMRKVIIGR